MIGLGRRAVKILPYSDKWKEEYIKEEKLLYSLIGEYVIDIEHIGSTSIKGLDSKPIIDIAIGVKSLDNIDKLKDLLEDAGYDFRGSAGVDGRVLFAKGSENLRTHYIHVEVFGGDVWKNHIYFRDYLRKNEKTVNEYSKLKKELAEKFADNRSEYTRAKNEFIACILDKAKKGIDK